VADFLQGKSITVSTSQYTPDFCWDRAWTEDEIRRRLGDATGFEWIRLAAWIMREARFEDVWRFLKPVQVRDHLSELSPLLGRKKDFWAYIIGAWHELGRI
jgi:hypothetical protein